MKTEIIEIAFEQFNEELTGLTCFEAPKFMRTKLAEMNHDQFGVFIIDGVSVKYYFSPAGMDGDIYTKDRKLKALVKVMIPAYYYSKLD